MSKGKRFYLPLLTLFLAACSSVPRQIHTGTAPYFSRAEEYFLKGKTYLEKGDMESARLYFDQSVDLLLDSGGSDPSIRNLVSGYLDKISSIELNFIKDRREKGDDRPEAFLDEVIATPLFQPAEKDILELRQKIGSSGSVAYSIPVVVNSQVVSFIKAFQTIKHEGIQNALNRSVEFLDTFRDIFKKYGIPEDLVYLPIIESGFRVSATSRARAKGMWQFMASTARLFGLRVDWVVDERLDPVKAADAAARFMKYLFDQYGDWYIVLACYNGGPSRVEKAMNHLQAKDFFEINQSRYMRRETKNYVPAFLASLIIAKSPAEYGFEPGKGEKIFADTKVVSIPSPVSLTLAASLIGVSCADLKQLNPELVCDYTPPHISFYSLRLPQHADESVLANMERLPPSKISTGQIYRVRKGDTLSQIARRFRMTVEKLKRVNGLRSNLIAPGRKLIIPRGNL